MTDVSKNASMEQHKASQDGLGLGQIIEGEKHRDAIHVAIAPAVAAARLWQGNHVGIQPDGKVGPNAKHIGIVDPFLTEGVMAGQSFWLFLYPGSITSLRHEWTHPYFPADAGTPISAAPESPVDASRHWIAEFAAKIDQTPNRLMAAADRWLDCGDYTRDDNESYKDAWGEFPEFWDHYAVVMGRDIPAGKREAFFTCSC